MFESGGEQQMSFYLLVETLVLQIIILLTCLIVYIKWHRRDKELSDTGSDINLSEVRVADSFVQSQIDK